MATWRRRLGTRILRTGHPRARRRPGIIRPDYESWVRFPGAFDELGFPVHEEGASTVVPGLYFFGVHFLRKRKSSLLNGVGEGAAIVARQFAARQLHHPAS